MSEAKRYTFGEHEDRFVSEYDYDALRDENTRLTNEVKRRIWLLHGSRLTHNLYGDDGNMDCNSCFRRYAEATLEQCYEWEIADAAMIVTKAALDGGKGVQGAHNKSGR